jgi:LCP family protein required for cell wall assembly
MLPPAAPFDNPGNVVNILLLGNDVQWAQGGRTDSLIIVSLNRETGEVTFLTIPRDLYVVIPGWMMNRINLALPHGHGTDYPGGGGALVKDTILYNLGIPIDYYVRLGFSGFKEIVDGLGGVEIVVNCPIEDWRLRSPDLDPEIEENWERYLLKPGVQQMDGDLALWYVRSRRNSNDLDRGRRQQKMVRAFLQQARSAEMLTKLPVLWEGFSEMFETDMGLADVLDLAALAPVLGDFEHLLLAGEAVRPWTVPHSGEAVQLLDRAGAEPVLRQLMDDTALHGVNRAPIQVTVETNNPIMYRHVADNLIWYGFEPSFVFRETSDPSLTTIEYRGSNMKGAFADRLSFVMRHNIDDMIFHEDGSTATTGYYISLGHGHNPCLPYLDAIEPGQIAGNALK